MKYEGLDKIDKLLKPYIMDSLKRRETLEWKMWMEVNNEYKRCVNAIAFFIHHFYGGATKFAGIDAILSKQIERQFNKLYEAVYSIIQKSLWQAILLALAPSYRLILDDKIFKLKQEKGRGETIYVKKTPLGFSNGVDGNFHNLQIDAYIAGEAELERREIEGMLDSVQYTMLEVAQEILASTLEKREIFYGKTFKVSTRLWNIKNGNQDTIKKIIAEGIHTDCKKVAQALELYTNAGGGKLCGAYPNMMARLKGRVPETLSFNAFRLARNELAEVYHKSALVGYKKNPYILACKWLLADNRLKQYEDRCNCNDLAYTDKFGLGAGIYPIEQVPARPHVMCLCNTAPVSSKKLREAVNEGLRIGNVPTEEWLEAQKKNETQFELNFSFSLSSIKK